MTSSDRYSLPVAASVVKPALASVASHAVFVSVLALLLIAAAACADDDSTGDTASPTSSLSASDGNGQTPTPGASLIVEESPPPSTGSGTAIIDGIQYDFAVSTCSIQPELVLVIGAQNSSNCNQLKAVAINKGVPAHLIIGPEELDRSWLKGITKVGITSGASTPEKQVRAVIEAIAPENVYRVGAGEENMTFTIPRGLRDLVGDGARRSKDELNPDDDS